MNAGSTITMQCDECGSVQKVHGSAFAGVKLSAAERAHDDANPDCPKRWSVPTGQEASE